MPARERIVAALWGFAEATFFFIVPDVFTSRLALTHGSARAFACCASAVVGALLGGSILFTLAHFSPATAGSLLALFDHLPGISGPLIETARQHVATHGASALVVSSATGIPYKVCTVQAALGGVRFPAFLMVSLLARALRFTAVTGFALLCQRLLLHRFSRNVRTLIHLAVWTLFYAWYFHTVSA